MLPDGSLRLALQVAGILRGYIFRKRAMHEISVVNHFYSGISSWTRGIIINSRANKSLSDIDNVDGESERQEEGKKERDVGAAGGNWGGGGEWWQMRRISFIFSAAKIACENLPRPEIRVNFPTNLRYVISSEIPNKMF